MAILYDCLYWRKGIILQLLNCHYLEFFSSKVRVLYVYDLKISYKVVKKQIDYKLKTCYGTYYAEEERSPNLS